MSLPKWTWIYIPSKTGGLVGVRLRHQAGRPQAGRELLALLRFLAKAHSFQLESLHYWPRKRGPTISAAAAKRLARQSPSPSATRHRAAAQSAESRPGGHSRGRSR